MIARVFLSLLSLAALLSLGGCKSSKPVPGGAGTPKWVPSSSTSFSGSTATPPHNLPPSEYPFDAAGNYLHSVARAGQRGSGSASASPPPRRSTASPVSSTPPKPKSSKTHRIVSGDTLWSLSRKYGVSVSAIKKANGMSSDKLVNGRSLRIP